MDSDHPQARHQKRHPEEKGSFGKSSLRKSSSRATRTQTPARRENPALDGFDAALKYDADKEPQRPILSTGATSSENVPSRRQAPSLIKEPREVILYGYPQDSAWAAISLYEKVSNGMICEDYEREPPMERKRFQGAPYIRARPLTKEEWALSSQYKGGQCWIKVTFDSIEAADRAVENSPHEILSHWVYAEHYRGQGPKKDQPIPVSDEDRQQGLLGPPKPMPRKTKTLGPSFTTSSFDRTRNVPRANATLPRSFPSNTGAENGLSEDHEDPSFSPSTASSGTATAVEYPNLHHRNVASTDGVPNSMRKGGEDASPISTTFKHFPNTPRTVLRPASEAFLPQVSWKDSMYRWLTMQGWIPGDLIGNTVPRLENGDFDSSTASFYWRFFYWIDSQFGTDWCGLKEN